MSVLLIMSVVSAARSSGRDAVECAEGARASPTNFTATGHLEQEQQQQQVGKAARAGTDVIARAPGDNKLRAAPQPSSFPSAYLGGNSSGEFESSSEFRVPSFEFRVSSPELRVRVEHGQRRRRYLRVMYIAREGCAAGGQCRSRPAGRRC